jgi:hypothetical protein
LCQFFFAGAVAGGLYRQGQVKRLATGVAVWDWFCFYIACTSSVSPEGLLFEPVNLMNRMKLSLLLGLFVGVFVASFDCEACSVCMGASGLTAEATNNAIFFMLGTLFLVFGGIIAAGISIVRKSRMAVSAYAELNSLVK